MPSRLEEPSGAAEAGPGPHYALTSTRASSQGPWRSSAILEPMAATSFFNLGAGRFRGGGQLPVGSWKWWSSSPKETYGISWTIWCFFNISVHAFPCGLVVHTISNLLIQTLHAHACPTILYSISMGYTHFSSPLACPPASTSSTLQRSRNLFGHCTARPLRRWAAPERGDWDDSRSLEMGRYIIYVYIYIHIYIYVSIYVYVYICVYIYVST